MSSKIITISALNNYIKHIINSDQHLKNISVVGEISNYTPHPSKHMYFTLKDDQARVECVMFANNAKSVEFPVKNGDKVVLNGYIDVYPTIGKYQLYVTKITLDGIGNLTKRFEELKKQLAAEGLFAAEHKKSLPKYPKRIGIITASSGAAIRDMIKTIESRYKLAQVYVFNTIVQGENGADSIINSLNLAQGYDLDVVIIGRGGGSIEDLWNFNEEKVIRKIFDFKIPIVSGVGHESDFTLCDLVADKRAETPTAAAVLVTPNSSVLLEQFDNVDNLINTRFKHILTNKKYLLTKYSVEVLKTKLNNSYLNYYSAYVNEIKFLDEHILRVLNVSSNTFSDSFEKLNFSIHKYYDKHYNYFLNEVTKLEQLNPLKILSRGYSVSYSDGKIVKSVADVNNNLRLLVADGEVKIEILSKEVKSNERD